MIEPISTPSPFLPLSEADAVTIPCSSSVLPLPSPSPTTIPPIPLCSSSRFTLTIDASSPSTVDSQGSGPLKLSLGDKRQSCESTAAKSSGSSARRKRQFDSHISADECIRYSDGTTEKYASAQHPVHTPTGTVPILVYYPTMKQIRDFNYLIELIERTGAHRLCGIVKVVPPPEWNPRGQLKSDFRDANDYLLENPVVERFEGERETFTRVLSVYSDQMKAKDYRKLATSAKFKPLPAALEMSDPVEIEKEFFANILDREAIYGADTEGSLYAKNVKEINMNCLGTILDETKSDGRIKGVNTVFLYFGMYKAMFPWHVEDMDLYSINYLLHGAPKYWFAIAPESAERFERIMASTFPNEFKHCKAFLRHKFAVATPEFLKKYDIKYGTMMHRENEIILTFPRGYHMGFNMGFNIAESTNFASDRWIDYGKTALLCQCRKDTVQIDMKKFMYKYRPDEAERWMSYWYGNEKVRSAEQPPIKPIFSPFVTVYPYKKIYPITDNNDDEGLSPAKKSKFESNRTPGSTNPYIYVMEHFNSKLLRLQSLRENFRLKLPGIDLDGCSHCAAPAPDIDSKSLRTSVFRKNHGLWARSPFALKEEHDHNAETAKIAPHCAVCQYFVAPGIRKIVDKIPDKSSVMIRRKSTFTKEDPSLAEDDEMPAQSSLWICLNCSMTVHACCYGIDEQNADANARSKWRCDRCSERNDHLIRSTSCNLCERRGGALIRTENGQDNETFVHIVCVILNRRSLIHFNQSPLLAFTYPFERDRPTEKLLDYFPLSYTMEFGNVYEKSAHQCSLCHYNREGLICCGMCKDLDLPEPTLMHATCAKAIGYKMELRNFPRVASLVCDRHVDYIVDKDDPDSVLPPLQIGEQVELIGEETESETDEEETKQVQCKDEGRMKEEKGSCRGRVEDIEWVPYAVLDFMDGTVSRDIPSNDIVEHSCDDCTPPMHTAGAVVKVRWSDNTIYEAYFRGMIATRDYRVQMQDGSIRLFQRKNLKSLSEMEEASQMCFNYGDESRKRKSDESAE